METPKSIQPITVSARTAELVLGLSWRTVLKLAGEHGIPILGTERRRIVEIAPLLAALKAQHAQSTPTRAFDDLSDEEQLAHYRSTLGLRLVTR